MKFNFKKILMTGTLLVAVLSVLFATSEISKRDIEAQAQGKPNVLFIMIDDLNDWVGVLDGHPQARTPNIDALAKQGTNFKNAQAGVPICNGSRTNIMTGMLPTRTGVIGNGDSFANLIPDAVTMVDSFRDAGYYTAGYGKIFHSKNIHKYRWDEFFIAGNPSPPAVSKPLNGMTQPGGNFDWGPLDIDPSEMGEYRRAQSGIDLINNWDPEDGPFFLAVGFSKPHLPWFCPQESYDKIAGGVTENILLPEVLASDLDDLTGTPKNWARPNKFHAPVVEAGQWQSAVHSYLACTSHVDDQIGRLMEALDSSQFADNTIVVLVSDHGFMLGEKSAWKKAKLWEDATHVPFVIRMPNHAENGYANQTNMPVNIAAIYPTLMELTGVEEPYADGHPNYKIDYRSIAPLVLEKSPQWSGAAFSIYGSGNISLRTFNYRYTYYESGDIEKYDHRTDPNEWYNLATDPENMPTDMQSRLNRVNRVLGGKINSRI